MLRVGLTGGIACGKSRVRRHLAAAGFGTLDLDAVAHEMMAPGGPAYDEVVATFGRGILAADGTVDRKVLGARVFAEDAQGMFLWADLGTDTNALATRLFDAGYLAAPGSLFCPSQLPSIWMRFNVASSQNPAMWRALQKALA